MTIRIEGEQGEGKSAVAAIIWAALEKAGCEVTAGETAQSTPLEPSHFPDEFESLMKKSHARRILNDLRPKVFISTRDVPTKGKKGKA